MNPAARRGPPVPRHWAHANRLLVRKALAEFAHERLVAPAPRPATAVGRPQRRRHGDLPLHRPPPRPGPLADRPGLHHPAPATATGAAARRRSTSSSNCAARSGLSDQVLPVYLEEITSTLAGTAYKLAKPAADRRPSWPAPASRRSRPA